jgi:hypothetical protein
MSHQVFIASTACSDAHDTGQLGLLGQKISVRLGDRSDSRVYAHFARVRETVKRDSQVPNSYREMSRPHLQDAHEREHRYIIGTRETE